MADNHNNNRDLETRHRDVDFGIRFRSEYIKILLALSTGVLAFSVTFSKDIVEKPVAEMDFKSLLVLSWMLLLLSSVAGVLHLRYWAWFFNSWGRAHDPEFESEWRAKVNARRIIAEGIQVYGFFWGLALFVAFAVWNVF